MQLSGAEAIIVPVLKVIMLLVMIGGGVAVFRELISMARGRLPVIAAKPEKEHD